MSSENAPFGLRPLYHPTGQMRANNLTNGITSGYATTLYQGQPVKLEAGKVVAAAVSEDFVGSFQGVQWADPNTGRTQFSNRWLASTTYVAGSCIATFYQDPGIIYAIQADGSIEQDNIGDQFDFTTAAIGTGNTTTGMSSATMSATPTVSEGQLRVLNLVGYADNEWADPYTVVQVQIAMHQLVANKVPIA